MKNIILLILISCSSGCVPIIGGILLNKHVDNKNSQHQKEIEYKHQERMEELRLQKIQLEQNKINSTKNQNVDLGY